MPFPFVIRISGEGVTFLSDVVESLLGGMALGFGWPLTVAEGVGAAWLGSAVTAGCCGDAVRLAEDSVEGLSLLSVGEGLLMSEAAEGSGLLAGEAADLTACCRLSWLGGGLSTCFLRKERRRTKGLWLLVDGRGLGTRNLRHTLSMILCVTSLCQTAVGHVCSVICPLAAGHPFVRVRNHAGQKAARSLFPTQMCLASHPCC